MILLSILASMFMFLGIDDMPENKQVKIGDDMEIIRITTDCYVYTEWADMGKWGRVGCNGLIVVSDGKALMVDSPVSQEHMKRVIDNELRTK